MKRVRPNDQKKLPQAGDQKRARKPSKGRMAKQRNAAESSAQASPAAAREPSLRVRREKGRWPKGVSGNRAGRTRGSKNKRTVIIEMMESKLGRKIPDPKKLTRYEAMFFKAIQKALGGDIRSMGFVLTEYRKAIESSTAAAAAATSEEDKQAYDAMQEKIRREIEEELRPHLHAEILREFKRKHIW